MLVKDNSQFLPSKSVACNKKRAYRSKNDKKAKIFKLTFKKQR